MKPIANTIVGYIIEEPNIANHGRLVGDKPTFFLRVFYPQRKQGWTKDPTKAQCLANRTRRIPFIIHPNSIEAITGGSPWRGQFVVVTYYVDVVEKGEEYKVLLYATSVEKLLDDYPEANISQESLWIDSNLVEKEIADVSI